MIIRQKIAKKLGIKTQGIQSENTKKHWVYKLSVQQVILIFEANDLSCFGIFKKRKHRDFLSEYNELFNNNIDLKKINTDTFLLKMFTRHTKLRAMYDSLTNCEGDNAKLEFKAMFHKDFETIEDLSRITKEADRLKSKMDILNEPVTDNKNGITFGRLFIIVEASRGIPIDREIKLFQFKELYDIELEKQNGTGHK